MRLRRSGYLSMFHAVSLWAGLICSGGVAACGFLWGEGFSLAPPPADIIRAHRCQAPAVVSRWACALTVKMNFQGQPTRVTPGMIRIITRDGAGWTPDGFWRQHGEITQGPRAGLALDMIRNTAAALAVQTDLRGAGCHLGEPCACVLRERATPAALLHRGAGLHAFDDSIALSNDHETRKKLHNG
jgi:hypothetical protein